MIWFIISFSPLDLSETEKGITTLNEDEYLTDIFQTEDDGDSGKCKSKMITYLGLTVTKKKLGLEQFPWIRTIFMFLDPN